MVKELKASTSQFALETEPTQQSQYYIDFDSNLNHLSKQRKKPTLFTLGICVRAITSITKGQPSSRNS